MTDIPSLLAEDVTGPLSQSDSLLWIRMRAALAEAQQEIERLNAQVLHLAGSLSEYEPAEVTQADLEEHARFDRMTDEEVMADLTSDGVTTEADVKQWSNGVATFARAMLTANKTRADLEGQLGRARDAARQLVAFVDDMGAFADDSDPRMMTLAGPIGEAQAKLYQALGLDLDAEHARLVADIDNRCAVCGFTLAESVDRGCVRGNCSLRPRPEKLYAPERAEREHAEMLARGAEARRG